MLYIVLLPNTSAWYITLLHIELSHNGQLVPRPLSKTQVVKLRVWRPDYDNGQLVPRPLSKT